MSTKNNSNHRLPASSITDQQSVGKNSRLTYDWTISTPSWLSIVEYLISFQDLLASSLVSQHAAFRTYKSESMTKSASKCPGLQYQVWIFSMCVKSNGMSLDSNINVKVAPVPKLCVWMLVSIFYDWERAWSETTRYLYVCTHPLYTSVPVQCRWHSTAGLALTMKLGWDVRLILWFKICDSIIQPNHFLYNRTNFFQGWPNWCAGRCFCFQNQIKYFCGYFDPDWIFSRWWKYIIFGVT